MDFKLIRRSAIAQPGLNTKLVCYFTDVWSWIVCDGDIDPNWIESLNSVLDDNRLLTLPSGWRVQFGSNVNFLFETHSLKYASPATVSRLGIVHVSEETYSLHGCIDKMIANLTEEKHPSQSSLKECITKCTW